MDFFIYALIDPRDGEIRYIGKTNNPRTRMNGHLSIGELRRRTYKSNWIKSVLARNQRPVMRILETADEHTYAEVECRQIALHRAMGCRLTNLTAGGEGTPGWTMSKETRRKIGEKARGRIHSPETRALYRARSKAAWADERYRQAQRKARCGKKSGPITEERRMNIARSKRTFTDEQIREIRRRYADGVSSYTLARMFSRSQSVMLDIAKRRSYQFVD